MDRKIFLIGFMGAGKTYHGQRLANVLGVPFIDLDAMIETGEGSTISEIFATKGETHFRILESEYLHRLAAVPQAVIATGGGTPCFFENLDWMKAAGLTVYLKTPVSLLVQRLAKQRAQRPLLANLSETELERAIEERLTERLAIYEQAERVVEQLDNTFSLAESLAL